MSEPKPYSMFTAEDKWDLFCKMSVAMAINEKIKNLINEDQMDTLSLLNIREEWNGDLRHYCGFTAYKRLNYSWDKLYFYWNSAGLAE